MTGSNPPFLQQLENTLQTYLYGKVPHLPPQWQELLVKILPYLVILFVVLSIPVILVFFGLGAALSPVMLMGGGVGSLAGFSFAIVFFAISVVLEAIAIPGLFKKSSQSWYLLYYSTLVNAVYNFLNFNLVGFIVGGAISLYLLFQIKKYYTHRV